MRLKLFRILLLLLSIFPFIGARNNLTDCLNKLKSDPTATGGVDYKGRPTSLGQAVGLTYESCESQCGPSPESFNWRHFAQLFSSWLLPWLALTSQLPFGSGNQANDFMSFIMSVGSPALAAYSLVLTSLNLRSVYQRAQRSVSPVDGRNAAKALICLQQVPLELTKDGRILASMLTDRYWSKYIVDHVGRKHSWTIAARLSTSWVVIAFLFTLVDSFVSLGTADEPSEGQAVGTLWLWLLCLVIGWLWVPTFSSGVLTGTVSHINRHALKRVKKRAKQKATEAIAELFRRVRRTRQRSVRNRTEALEMTGESIQGGTEDVGEGTDQKELGHPSAGESQPVNQIVSVLPHSAHQGEIRSERNSLFILKDLGALNRDEHRTPATFNYSRIMRFLVLVDDVFATLNRLAHETQQMGGRPTDLVSTEPTANPTFPHGAFTAMFNAFIFALILQCGVSAGATLIVVFTPTIGLGCRSLAYILYTGVSIMILVFAIISTILARIAETCDGRPSFVQGFTTFIAIALRRINRILALLNTTGLLLISCFQFSNVLDNCYCNSTVLGRGTSSYIIMYYDGWIDTMRTYRIIATALAGASMLAYMLFLWLMSAPLAELMVV